MYGVCWYRMPSLEDPTVVADAKVLRFVAGGRGDSTTWRLPGGALSARGLCVVIRPAGSEIGRTTIRPELTHVVFCPAKFGLRQMESGNLWRSGCCFARHYSWQSTRSPCARISFWWACNPRPNSFLIHNKDKVIRVSGV